MAKRHDGGMARVVLVTGVQAAGKSTVGPALAQRLGPPAAYFEGDVLYNMVLAGNVDMTPVRDAEAVRQVRLRYRASALLAQFYVDNGFDFVCGDIVLGADVAQWLDSIHGADRHLVVLNPTVEAVAARERGRGSNSYRDWRTSGESLEEAIALMARDLDETPRRGLWIDTSQDTAEQTVARILADDLRASLWAPA
jgi:chloramphenicol 3-O-phosphotransferase